MRVCFFARKKYRITVKINLTKSNLMMLLFFYLYILSMQIKSCLHCQSTFEITMENFDFYQKISPIFVDQKIEIPSPTLCPDCRQRRRMAFRNERNLYRRSCDASGKQIISIYKPDCGFKVYDQKIWWSDSRDAMTYEREFDF